MESLPGYDAWLEKPYVEQAEEPDEPEYEWELTLDDFEAYRDQHDERI